MNRTLIIIITVALSVCSIAEARTVADTVLVNFRQSKVEIDTTYMANKEALGEAGSKMHKLATEGPKSVLENVWVIGGASPEGSVAINERLSRERARNIFKYMGARYAIPDSVTKFTFLGRDWVGLKNMVVADPEVPFREDVLGMLDRIIGRYEHGEMNEENLLLIKHLHNGVPYRYMYEKLFPALRASKLVMTFSQVVMPVPAFPPESLDVAAGIEMPPVIPLIAIAPYAEKRPFYMGLKTNMLFDALAVPNIGAEFYLGKNLSIVGNWMYGWWKTDRRHRYWRIYGGDLALRWWFGKKAHEKPLTGHHIGIYGGVLTYDFEWGGKGYMGGLPGGTLWDRCNHEFGVEYGYSLPIARRFNIDFTLGVGYLGGQYREYVPMDKCYVWQATKYRHWVGPTKLEVSLVWLLGRGNVNIRKGGES